MRLNQKISTKNFVISQIVIFLFGLTFIGFLYYILNSNPPLGSLKNYLPVTKEPKSFNLEINTDDELLVFDNNILISGKSSPYASIVIFTQDKDEATLANAKGEFSKIIPLSKGLNNLIVTAFDDEGNSKSQERTIYYSEEKI